jgi:hypothetical protein
MHVFSTAARVISGAVHYVVAFHPEGARAFNTRKEKMKCEEETRKRRQPDERESLLFDAQFFHRDHWRAVVAGEKEKCVSPLISTPRSLLHYAHCRCCLSSASSRFFLSRLQSSSEAHFTISCVNKREIERENKNVCSS